MSVRINLELLLFHLGEAEEQLAQTMAELKTGEMDEETLKVQVAHVYHHLNSGWNSRHEAEFDGGDFFENRKMPEDIAHELLDPDTVD